MNKNLMFLAIVVIVALALVGSIVLRLLRPDAEATFINTVTTMLGILTTTIVLIWGLGSQDKKLESIKEQTNGNLSRRDDEIVTLRQQLLEHGITPAPGPELQGEPGKHARVE